MSNFLTSSRGAERDAMQLTPDTLAGASQIAFTQARVRLRYLRSLGWLREQR